MEQENCQQSILQQIKTKSIFIFDWDGTIFNSMELKSKNFDQAFKLAVSYKVNPNQVGNIAEQYLKFSGHPRKQIFFEIVKILEEKINFFSFEHFNQEFEVLNKETLLHASVFVDAIELIRELSIRNCKVFISSSVPQRELADLVNSTLLDSLKNSIASILGSEDGFSKGIGHLRWIMNETGSSPCQLLVIGDDPADYELSQEAGVDCILIDRFGKMQDREFHIFSDLNQVKEALRDEV